MTEEKVSTQYHARVKEVDGVEGKDFIITQVGSCKKCLHKYEIVWPVPNVGKMIDEGATLEDLGRWFKDARGLDLQEAVNAAVRKMSTQPNYQLVGFDKDAEPTKTADPNDPENPYLDYPEKPNAHEEMQNLADGFTIGRAVSLGTTVKKKASQLDALEEQAKALGFDSVEALVKAMAAKG